MAITDSASISPSHEPLNRYLAITGCGLRESVGYVPGLSAAAAGIAAFITGLISVVRSRERSVSVYLAVGFGLIILVFVLGEIISPH